MNAAPLSAADRFFLQTNLLHLQAANGLIPPPLRDACRGSLEAALRGAVPVIDAAADLAKGHTENILQNLQERLRDPEGLPVPFVKKLERYPLAEMDGRLKGLSPGIRRLLSETRGDLEVIELIANYDDVDDIPVKKVKNEIRISYGPPVITTLYRLVGLGEFYRAVIHPKGSRVWRYLPLPLLIGAIAMVGGETAAGVQWTPHPSTLDEMRDVVAQNKKPICVGSRPALPPELQDSPEVSGLDKPAFCRAHGEIYDAYRMLIHDLCHVIEWNELRPAERDEEVLLHDRLMEALRRFPEDVRSLPVFDEIRDSLFSYYYGEARAPEMVESSLRHAAGKDKRIEPSLIAGVAEAFRSRLRS